MIGNIFAKELIVLSDCAVVHGDISAEAFTITNCAVIEGMMLQANRKVRDPQSAQLRSRLPTIISVTTARPQSKQSTKLKHQK